MKVNIQNIPPIVNSSINVKNLTVIVGMNNTGKTLFAHVIHALYNEDINCKILKRFFREDKDMIDLYKKLVKNNRTYTYEHDKNALYSICIRIMEYYKSNTAANLINNFIFNTDSDSDNIIMSRDFLDESYEDFDKLVHQMNYIKYSSGNKNKIIIEKDKNNYINYTINSDYYRNICKNGTFCHDEIIFEFSDFYANIFSKFALFTRKTIPFPAERAGLIIAKNQMTKFPNKMAEHYVDFLDQKIDTNKKTEDKYYSIAEYIENHVLFGSISCDITKNIFFNDKNQNSNIYMERASSSVRELSGLVIYLKYLAKANDSVIIDEPELSLHPDAVRYIAKAIAMLSNRNINVIIITHSDYFVKEINSLTNLYNYNTKYQDLIKEGFGDDFHIDMTIDCNKISMYSFIRNGKGEISVNTISCDKYGFIEPLFDKTIKNLNHSEDIALDIKDEINQ